MKEKYQLTAEGLKALEKMGAEGAKKASESLSKLINRSVALKALAVRTLPVERIPEIIGSPEDLVTNVIFEVHGDVWGNISLIYPQKSALCIADFLAKRKTGTTHKLNELDKSALKESGNIISGSFLSALSNYLGVNMLESIPDIATDMLKATIDFVVSKFAEKAKTAVAFEIDFEMGLARAGAGEEATGYFVLLLDVESTTKVLEALRKRGGGGYPIEIKL